MRPHFSGLFCHSPTVPAHARGVSPRPSHPSTLLLRANSQPPPLAHSRIRLTLPRTLKPLRKLTGQGLDPLSLLHPYSTTEQHPLSDLHTILNLQDAPLQSESRHEPLHLCLPQALQHNAELFKSDFSQYTRPLLPQVHVSAFAWVNTVLSQYFLLCIQILQDICHLLSLFLLLVTISTEEWKRASLILLMCFHANTP